MEQSATCRWLDELAKKEGDVSDYRLSQILELPASLISKYRNHGVQMDDEKALRLAVALDVHPLKVIGEIRAERSRDARTRKFWLSAAKSAAVILTAGATALFSGFPSESEAAPAKAGGNSLYIMLNHRRRIPVRNSSSALAPLPA